MLTVVNEVVRGDVVRIWLETVAVDSVWVEMSKVVAIFVFSVATIFVCVLTWLKIELVGSFGM